MWQCKRNCRFTKILILTAAAIATLEPTSRVRLAKNRKNNVKPDNV